MSPTESGRMSATNLTDLQKLLNNSPDGIWAADWPPILDESSETIDPVFGWRYRYVSAAVTRIAGLPPGQIAEGPHQFWQLVPSSERPRLFESLTQFLLSEALSRDFEYRIQRPGGEFRWIQERLAVRRDDAGKPGRLDGVARDVSEQMGQMGTRHTPRENETWLDRMIRTNPNGILTIDAEDRIQFANHAARHILGMENHELIDRSWHELPFQHPIPLPGRSQAGSVEMVDDGPPNGYEAVLFRPDGRRLILAVWLSPMREDDGEQTGTIVTFSDVTSRRRAEEARRASEERLSRIVETITDGILLVDQNFRITFANTAAERIFGRVRRDLCAQCWYQLPWQPAQKSSVRHLTEELSAEDPPLYRASPELIHRMVIREGRSITGHERIIHPGTPYSDARPGDSTLRAGPVRVSSSFVPLHNAWGNIVGMVISFTDITERTRVEEKLRRGEERFRALVEKATDGILLTDADGRIVYASASTPKLLGYDHSSMRGRDAVDLVHPDDLNELKEAASFLLANPGQARTGQIRCRHSNGSWRLLEVTGCNRLRDPSVTAVVLNYRDITESHRAQIALARQHTLLSGLINSVPDLIFYKDPTGRYLGCNTAFEEFAGRLESELVGCTDDVLDDQDVFWREAEENVIADRNAHRAEGWFRYPSSMKPARDGKDRKVLIEMLLTPLFDGDGGYQGLIGIGRDLTERKRLEEQVRHTGQIEAIGQLAGGVAHDFNNLLTVILANAAIIQEKANQGNGDYRLPRELVDKPLTAVQQAASQAADLTTKLLGFARKSTIHKETVSVNEVIREMSELIRRTIDPRIEIHINLAENLWPIEADRVMLNQVLINLCLNARDAMPDGGELTIETVNQNLHELGPQDSIAQQWVLNQDARPGQFVRIRVRDTGCGMTTDIRARIFEPFFTTKPIGQGTGMGLPMAQGILVQHKGWIDCQSVPGTGTRFDIYLPRSSRELVEPIATESVPSTGKESILLVDDEPMIRDLGRAILETYGYQVTTAEDGLDALRIYQEKEGCFDLVLLDLTMPNLSGRDTLKRLRAISPDVRVMIASGYSSESLGDCSELGISGFLGKPYRPSQLTGAVRAALDHNKSEG